VLYAYASGYIRDAGIAEGLLQKLAPRERWGAAYRELPLFTELPIRVVPGNPASFRSHRTPLWTLRGILAAMIILFTYLLGMESALLHI
jgi:hypothetical protein